MKDLKYFRWSWTLNNPTDQEKTHLMSLTNSSTNGSKETGIVYIIIGQEKGSQGTVHLQGYTEFSSRMRMSQVKKLLGDRIHAERSIADATKNKEYCSKENNLLLEWGVPRPRRGHNAKEAGRARASQLDDRLGTIKEILDEGGTLEDCWESDFAGMVRYGRGIYEYALMKRSQRKPPKVTVLTGAAGTGKTRFVYDHARIFYDDDIWSYPGAGWFDGYIGQKVVLFDDYRGDIPIELFLKVLDRYPIRVPVKGGFRHWKPEVIFITSNESWKQWYGLRLDRGTEAALRRRFHVVHEEINESIY